jgi:hypothetical protein
MLYHCRFEEAGGKQLLDLTTGIRHPASGIWHPASGIWHPASGIRHLASGIWHPASGIWHPASVSSWFAEDNDAVQR